jgi:uncharacterized protein (TIGR02266 family)
VNPLRRDTRRYVRASLELPVVVSDASNRVQGGIRFESADVSGGGAFLRSDLLFEVGEVLNLDFHLPGGRRIQTRGRVVRVSRDHTDERSPGMGVEFVDLAAEDRAAIEERIL